MRVILSTFMIVCLLHTNPVSPAGMTKSVECDYDIELLATTVYGEARGESFLGRKAVVDVVRNRMDGCRLSSKQVLLHQGYNAKRKTYEYAFEGAHVEVTNKKLYDEILSEVQLYLSQDDITDGATHFYSGDKKPYWTASLTYVKTIGGHHFYR